MPWDKTNRTKYDYKTGRYPSDMTNAQWAIIGNYSGTPTSVIPYRALEPDLKVDYLTISIC